MFYEVILLRMCLVHTNSGTTVHLVCSHWCKDCNPSSAEVALDLSPLCAVISGISTSNLMVLLSPDAQGDADVAGWQSPKLPDEGVTCQSI